MIRMRATAAPIRLQQNLWEVSVSVAAIDSGPVVDFLRSPCCQDPREREDSQKYDLQESPGIPVVPVHCGGDIG